MPHRLADRTGDGVVIHVVLSTPADGEPEIALFHKRANAETRMALRLAEAGVDITEARAAAGRGSPAPLGDTTGSIRIRSIDFVD